MLHGENSGPDTRFDAELRKATKRPSALKAGLELWSPAVAINVAGTFGSRAETRKSAPVAMSFSAMLSLPLAWSGKSPGSVTARATERPSGLIAKPGLGPKKIVA